MLHRKPFLAAVLLALPLALLLAAPAARADVLVVDADGGGDFTTLSAAVAAAQSGDTLLVAAGTYAEAGPVLVDGKSLTIAGERPRAGFYPDVTVQPGLIVRNLPAGQHVVIENLRLIGAPGTATDAAQPALLLEDNLSHVRLQNCVLWGGGGEDNAHPDGAAAVFADDSDSMALVGCSVLGGPGQFSPDLGVVAGDGGPGIDFAAGQMLVYESYIDGGSGGSNIVGGWPQGGIGGAGIAHHDSVLFAVGSGLRGGVGGTSHHGGAGGDGLSMGVVGVAWLMGGTYTNGGDGGWSDDGPDGADGLALDDPAGLAVDHGGTQKTFDLTSPLREGETGSLAFGGGATDTAFVFASLALHQIPFPAHQGVLMLSPGALLGPFVIGPPGDLDVPFSVPELGPGWEALDVHVQAAYAGSGGVLLGPARVLTLLDGAF